MKYQVIDCEIKAFQKDGETRQLKKLSLLPEGQEKVEPRVTMWEDHPEFEMADKGKQVTGILEKKDSGTPIPQHPGKNYVNRTLLPEVAPEGDKNLEGRIKNLEDRVKALEEGATDEINPEDIPF